VVNVALPGIGTFIGVILGTVLGNVLGEAMRAMAIIRQPSVWVAHISMMVAARSTIGISGSRHTTCDSLNPERNH